MPSTHDKFDHFELVERLGSGGMGEVFLARDTTLDRKVAIKFLPETRQQDEIARERFRREARSAAALDHPYICKIYEVGEFEGKAYIAMEYVEGKTLHERLARGPFRLPELLRIGAEIGEAVEAAHQKNIVHRDLKAPNIIVTPDGHAKVMDFGLALRLRQDDGDSRAETLSHRLSSGSDPPGTVIYMSPEQVRGDPLDGRSDVFSLGVVLYEMATAELPFQGATSGLTYDAILNRGPASPRALNPDVPLELEHIIFKALEKNPEERYQSAKELVVDLRRLLRDTSASPPLASETRPASRRRTPFAWLAVGIALPVLLFLAYLLRPSAPERTIDSLAVLPFDNSQKDPDVDYLSDGIAETLINRLSQLQNLRVMARSTAFRYRGPGVDPQQVGRELGVGAVLTGRVVQQGSVLNVQTELVDVASGSQLWGDQFTHEISDLASLQNEITREISQALRIDLTSDERAELERSYTKVPEAYRAYLRGRHLWNKRTNEDFKKAIVYFEDAKRLDPNYALADVGLADCYMLLGAQFYGRDADFPPEEANEKARQSALSALRIDDRLAEPRATLGWITYLVDWKFGEAEKLFREAIERNPSYVTTHHYYAYLLSTLGRHEEAIEQARKTVEIEPSSPLYNRTLGMILSQAHRLEEAETQLERTLELDADFPLTRDTLMETYWIDGRYDDAIRVTRDKDAEVADFLEQVRDGKKNEALRMLDSPNWPRLPLREVIRLHGMAGDWDGVFGLANGALQGRNAQLPIIISDPFWELAGEDPRRRELERRMGLER